MTSPWTHVFILIWTQQSINCMKTLHGTHQIRSVCIYQLNMLMYKMLMSRVFFWQESWGKQWVWLFQEAGSTHLEGLNQIRDLRTDDLHVLCSLSVPSSRAAFPVHTDAVRIFHLDYVLAGKAHKKDVSNPRPWFVTNTLKDQVNSLLDLNKVGHILLLVQKLWPEHVVGNGYRILPQV